MSVIKEYNIIACEIDDNNNDNNFYCLNLEFRIQIVIKKCILFNVHGFMTEIFSQKYRYNSDELMGITNPSMI